MIGYHGTGYITYFIPSFISLIHQSRHIKSYRLHPVQRYSKNEALKDRESIKTVAFAHKHTYTIYDKTMIPMYARKH